jgi:hypothetical protein
MSDVEQDLRDRLRAAPPAFAPVPLAAVATLVEDRRRATRAAARAMLLTAAVLFSGAAILVPALTLGHGGGASNSAGGAAYSGQGNDSGVTAPQAGTASGAPPATASPASGRACPPRMTGNAIVDYVDFVRIGGREYIAGRGGPVRTVPRARLGRKLGTVRCELSAIRPDPYYHPVDGDAGYLPAGTPVYEVSGSGRDVVAAPVGGGYRLYQVYPAQPGPR